MASRTKAPEAIFARERPSRYAWTEDLGYYSTCVWMQGILDWQCGDDMSSH